MSDSEGPKGTDEDVDETVQSDTVQSDIGDMKTADSQSQMATDDEDSYAAITKRLYPPLDTPKEEKNALYLEDVRIAKKSKPVNYVIAWPSIQMQVMLRKFGKYVKYGFYILLLVVYFAWLIAGCVLEFDRTLELLILTIVVLFFVFWELVAVRFWDTWTKPFQSCGQFMQTNFWFALIFGLIVLLLFVGIIAWDAKDDVYKLVPVAGWLAMTYMLVLISLFPHRIHWRPVLWGNGLGFVFALFVLRTEAGIATINYLSDQITTFLAYADEGALFVFGQYWEEVWCFSVLPVIIYFAAVVAVLFYTGALQYVIKKLCWLMELTMYTSGAESLVAAANIFVGQTESPLLIGPFAKILTRSELLACMTCGFASIAGSVFGAFVSMGVDAAQLLTAIVTSAPIGLACAKVVHPEVEESKTKSAKDVKPEQQEYISVLDAFAGGASQAVPLCVGIVTQLIAFVSIIAFLDGILMWLGLMIRMEDFTIDLILSYCFYPFAILCGVEIEDCLLAGKYMGIRLFINEFVAYGELVDDVNRRDEECCNKYDSSGKSVWLNPRSETICVYALCGFANFSSVGIMIGGLSGLAPTRKTDITTLVIPALFAANFCCLIRGSISGILYQDNWTDPCSSRSPC